jgi:hypothetical protein
MFDYGDIVPRPPVQEASGFFLVMTLHDLPIGENVDSI